jgi:hypothetical protein
MGRPASRVATAQPIFIITDQVCLHQKGKPSEEVEIEAGGCEGIKYKVVEGLPLDCITITDGGVVQVVEDIVGMAAKVSMFGE